MPGCRGVPTRGPVCEAHDEMLPFDLVYRLEQAYADDDRMERDAALHAVVEYMKESS